jgi:hypothetical protein
LHPLKSAAPVHQTFLKLKTPTPSYLVNLTASVKENTMPDIDPIRRQLKNHPGIRLGFVVYRLTYSDDSRWAQFMDHLNTRVRIDLENDGDGDVFTHIDWDVQEDYAL